jgi:PAS domain S-box-containing protein
VIVTDEFALVHVSDRAARYLRIAPGEPTRDLIRLVAPELRADLRSALHQASRQRSSVQLRSLADTTSGEGGGVTITVRPVLQDNEPARGYFVIVFEEAGAAPAETPVPLNLLAEPVNLQLEEELTRLRLQLRTTIEQYETQVEEVKASNEELQAMNEELWSATEELETSKEELQSVNEELITVNQELKIKIEELALTNNDFQNLINSTDIGTIFLDRTLRVKMSTPRVADVFNLLPADIGRPLSHITSRLHDDRMHDDVAHVLRHLVTVEREVETRDGRWFLMRVLPYRTTDDRIDGVVITFQDVTSRHTAEQQVQTSADLQQRIAEHQLAEREIAGLLRKLVDNQEDQRARIARDLHDQLGQQLTALRLVLERHRGECTAATRTLDEALAITRKIDGDVDFLTWELRPTLLEDLGLSIALSRYVEEWSKRFAVSVECQCLGLAPQDLTREAEVVFYRVAQEALNNAAKHAHATRVDIIIERRNDTVRLVIEDDGVGFEPAAVDQSPGLGLVGMRERAALIGATLQVESRPGHGASIFLTAPIAAASS